MAPSKLNSEKTPEWAVGFDWALIESIASRHSIDPLILGALIQTESAGDTFAVRFEKFWRWGLYEPIQMAKKARVSIISMMYLQKFSWGLCQVMGVVAYENGLGAMNSPSPVSLTDPAIGMEFGCRVLKKLKSRWGGDDPATLYAAYNGGSPKKKSNGDFRNQLHVDRFMRYYRQIQGAEIGSGG